MYRCQNCNVLVPAGTKVHRAVVETRPKVYTAQAPPAGRKRKNTKGRFQANETSGWEIVRELQVCTTCYADLAETVEAAANVLPAPTMESVLSDAMDEVQAEA
jgi:hypothetical protein